MMIKGSRQCVRLIIDTAALALCIYQIAFMLSYIIRGETRTRLKISESQTVDLPNIYVCFPIYNLINITRLREKYPSMTFAEPDRHNEFDVDKTLLKIVSTMGVKELKSTIKDPNRIISSVHPAPSIDDIYKTQVTPNDCVVTNNLLGNQMCTIISCTKNGSTILYKRKVVERGEANGYLMLIKFTPYLPIFSTSLSIMVVPRNKVIDHKAEALLFFDFYERLNVSFEFVLSFKIYKTIYKENDFYDQCTNYRLEGYKNRIDKVHQCLNNLTKQKINSPFSGILQPLDHIDGESHTGLFQAYLEYLITENETRSFYHNLIRSFKVDCLNLAPYPDCDDVSLRPMAKKVVYGNNNESTLMMKMASTPTMSNIIIPYYDWDDFIVYTQSAVGIWLGISPIIIIDWIIDWLTETLNGLFQVGSLNDKSYFDYYGKRIIGQQQINNIQRYNRSLIHRKSAGRGYRPFGLKRDHNGGQIGVRRNRV